MATGRWLSDMMDKLTTTQKVARERKATPKPTPVPTATDLQSRRKTEGDAWSELEAEERLRK